MKPITIGILPQEKIRARLLAIAKGKYHPKPGEPKIWFTSLRSLAEVLSEDNRALLKVICDAKPESIANLAAITGKHPGNLSRTLSTMARYGFVELRKNAGTLAKTPLVKATDFRILASA